MSSFFVSLSRREGAPDEEGEHQLPKEKLLLLTDLEPVTDYVSTCDYLLYQCIVDFLIPNVLRPIPGTLTQAIRNFAKSLEMWLTSTIHGYSRTLIKSKVRVCVCVCVCCGYNKIYIMIIVHCIELLDNALAFSCHTVTVSSPISKMRVCVCCVYTAVATVYMCYAGSGILAQASEEYVQAH